MHCHERRLSLVVLFALFTSLVALQAASAATVTDFVSHRQGRPHLPRADAYAQTAEASCTQLAFMRDPRIHERMLLHVARWLSRRCALPALQGCPQSTQKRPSIS